MKTVSARSLAWWSPPALHTLSGPLQACWRQWCTQWEFDATSVESFNSAAVPDLEHASYGWYVVGYLDSGEAALWIGVPGFGSMDWIMTHLFGSDAVDGPADQPQASVAELVTQQAWLELGRGLAHALGLIPVADPRPLPQAFPERDLQRWSGAVDMALGLSPGPIDGILLHIGDRVAALQHNRIREPSSRPSKRSALVSVTEALRTRPVALSVNLSSVQIDIGTLQSLRVGDVIALPQSLDEPLALQWVAAAADDPCTAAICQAHLGRRAGHLAVELMPARSGMGG
jgi:flagellar motor switch/type III secretory pathway protein FliN